MFSVVVASLSVDNCQFATLARLLGTLALSKDPFKKERTHGQALGFFVLTYHACTVEELTPFHDIIFAALLGVKTYRRAHTETGGSVLALQEFRSASFHRSCWRSAGEKRAVADYSMF
eukprot:4421016-Pyramimonas_sp.AAC.1